jgi:2-polyprenyl-3-methyl-5-hydroxy-6-metoxy-1,4-benzoquinol methylase
LFKCPICANDEYQQCHSIKSTLQSIPKGLTRGFSEETVIYTCSNCDLEFSGNLLSGFDYDALYSERSIYSKSQSYQNSASDYPKYSKDTVDTILSVCNPANTILEVGPFKGDLMLALKQKGYIVEGVELDPNAADFARTRGLDIITGNIYDNYFNGKKYDVIVAIGVLEHIKEPDEWLLRLRTLLNDSGQLILQFPNPNSLNAKVSQYSPHNWDMYLEPGHIYFFSLKNISILLEKLSFRITQAITATIISRGKLPFLPKRNVKIESAMRQLIRNRYFYRLYKIMLLGIDILRAGDTWIIIAHLSRKEINKSDA